ncbi:YceI family protein [Segnochrobactrum spirostomi]|uniref:YceI family protein n=1 Tax=Segnochrobactrum spirostomi TaxID=2608987 RepID=A0A6A7YC66_9HYPH|nr:YceI family protein [Segnochrobactrum spirostomi]MQT15558.1 YceI family protein [Segnochrobactrum spirostomi]
MKRSALYLAAALALSPVLVATPGLAEGPTTNLADVRSGAFALDPAHAKIIFSTSHFGFSTYYGLFKTFDAKLNFDAKAPAKSTLEVTVQMNSVDTTNPKLDEHLESPDFFDAAKFPTATFKSTKIVVTGAHTGKITGDLTLHGVTKPVTLDATFNGGGENMFKAYVLGFSATTVIKRTEFGIKTYAPAVGDDVKLIISAEFDAVK